MLIITIGISIYLTTLITTLREENTMLVDARTQLTDNIKTLNQLNDESNQMLQSLTIELQQLNEEKLNLQNELNSAVTLDELSIDRLKEKGYEDYALILNDLRNHNELIPFDGVLGGSMAWQPDRAFLLNYEWAYAMFEDGHISGAALLKFEIKDNKRIQWTVVDAALDTYE